MRRLAYEPPALLQRAMWGLVAATIDCDPAHDIWTVDVTDLVLERDSNAWPRAGYWRYRGNIEPSRLTLLEPWTVRRPWTNSRPLLKAVEAEAPGVWSTVHGWPHAEAVAKTGRWLADRVAGADRAVAIAFGLLHDMCRHNDGVDEEHGARAAAYAADLHRRGLLNLGHGRPRTSTTGTRSSDSSNRAPVS